MPVRPLAGANTSLAQGALGIGLTKNPPEGPKCFNILVNFQSENCSPINMQLGDIKMTMLQTLYIDNSANEEYVYFNLNGQNCVCPPISIGFIPLLFTGTGLNITGETAGFPVLVTISLLNIMVPTFQSFDAGTAAANEVFVTNFPASQEVTFAEPIEVTGTFYQAIQPVSGTIAVSNFPATQAVSGSVAVNNFPGTQPVSIAATVNVNQEPLALTKTDYSLALTASNQVAVAANTSRKGYRFQLSNSAASGSVAFVNFGVAASTSPSAGDQSFELTPGQILVTNPPDVLQTSINVIGNTAAIGAHLLIWEFS